MDRRGSDCGLFRNGRSTSSKILTYSGPFVLKVSLVESVRLAGHVASMVKKHIEKKFELVSWNCAFPKAIKT